VDVWIAHLIIGITTYFSILDDKVSVVGEIFGAAYHAAIDNGKVTQ